VRTNRRITLWVALIGLWMLWSIPTLADPSVESTSSARIYKLTTQQQQSFESLTNQLAQANVVYLAETHDRVQDHQAQLQIMRSLASRRTLVIGMEMFQRPFQWALDQYLAGQISEAELLRLTEYQRRWGYDWELYAPILRFARAEQIPVLALNTPSEVTRKVSRTGLDQLSFAERQWIPSISTILAEPDAYRQRIRQIYEEMHQGKGTSAGFEQFFLAQVLWDETIADRIAIALRRSPESLIIVLAGQGHILYGDGIPDRVQRRIPQVRSQLLQQVTVILNPASEVKRDPSIADFFWFSP